MNAENASYAVGSEGLRRPTLGRFGSKTPTAAAASRGSPPGISGGFSPAAVCFLYTASKQRRK